MLFEVAVDEVRLKFAACTPKAKVEVAIVDVDVIEPTKSDCEDVALIFVPSK